MTEGGFREFVRQHVERVQPLETGASLAWWEAATTGRAQAYRREADLQSRVESVYADRDRFRFLEQVRESGVLADPLDNRLLEVLYRAHLARQCSPDLLHDIVCAATEVEERFATFRPELDGRKLSENDVEEVLTCSDDPDYRRRVWRASKDIGPAVAQRVRELARLRNRAARELGFDDYYRLSLALAEQSPGEVEALFDELDRRTELPFAKYKARLDDALAGRFRIGVADLAPWHYPDPFFQEVPDPPELGLDRIFADQDLLHLAAVFYRGIGLDIQPILDRSDIYEQDGKNQHAFCVHIDREGDVRVLLNVKPTARWMSAALHEFGHAVYDAGIPNRLPYPLRIPAHTFVTEGVAMLFGRMPYTASWLKAMRVVSREDGEFRRALADHQAIRQLVFARWCQVIVRFERALYADPEADLNDAWWSLVERYQRMSRPVEPNGDEWATKVHIVSSPVYYHNYLIGEMFASQLLDSILAAMGESDGDEGRLVGRPEVGHYLRERVLSVGATIPWPAFVEQATGAPLSATFFVRRLPR